MLNLQAAGVVSNVFVKEGDIVKKGEPLFDVEAKGLTSRRNALETTLSLYELQARALKSVVDSDGDPSRFEPLPPIPVVDDPILNAQLIDCPSAESAVFDLNLSSLNLD